MTNKLILFSGAGISAESDVPTFRGPDGLWEGHDIDVVCNYRTWKKNFEAVHSFYNGLRVRLESVSPNAAHEMFVDWQKRYGATLITQNVDDLFERAGAKQCTHLHGRLTSMKCEACGEVWDVGYTTFDPTEGRCPAMKCGSRKGVKPHVVFFNENAPEYEGLYRLFKNLTAKDTIVVLGTSSKVVDITGFIKDLPGFKIYSNLDTGNDDRISHVYDEHVFAPATEAVHEIDALLRSHFEG